MDNVNFVIGVDKVYRLAGNNWYAVEQDDDKVMLVDTDCEVTGEKLETTWSNDNSDNGQCVLNYTNALADKYFAEIKYAIVSKDVDCKNGIGEGRGEIKGAYMWPMSADEFWKHKDIGGSVSRNAQNRIWTRTFAFFSTVKDAHDIQYFACVNGNSFSGANKKYCFSALNNLLIAPAFYLNKAMIDHIAEDGKIILMPASELVTNK